MSKSFFIPCPCPELGLLKLELKRPIPFCELIATTYSNDRVLITLTWT